MCWKRKNRAHPGIIIQRPSHIKDTPFSTREINITAIQIKKILHPIEIQKKENTLRVIHILHQAQQANKNQILGS